MMATTVRPICDKNSGKPVTSWILAKYAIDYSQTTRHLAASENNLFVNPAGLIDSDNSDMLFFEFLTFKFSVCG